MATSSWTASVALGDPPEEVRAGRPSSPVRTLLMTASIRTDRFGPVPAAWVADHAHQRADLDLETVDLAQASLPFVLSGNDPDEPLPTSVTTLGSRLAAAEAVVVVTPVYNRGYPASLKNAIDWFDHEWARTPVGFVSYGGRTGGVEAVEQLRPIFVELRTMTIRPVLSFPNFWNCFDAHGRPVDPDGAARAADAFFDELVWWALTMRQARAEVSQ